MKQFSFAFFIGIIGSLAIQAQSLNAPSDLAVAKATSSQVDLVWATNSPDATAYIVERKVLGTASYGSVATVPKADKLVYSDKAIDPYATYLYRVRATRQPDNSATSNPSSEVIVGPPPPGMSLVTPYRPELNLYEATDFGRRTAMALDANGDPAIVYYIFTPEDYHFNSFLEFVSWNRASYRWNPPVKVGVIANAEGSGPGSNLMTLARDKSDNTWVVSATQTPDYDVSRHILLFSSVDNGVTWKQGPRFADSDNELFNPSVAIDKGIVHLAYYGGYLGIRYAKGKLSDPVEKWTNDLVPLPTAATDYRQELDLQLDSNGDAGIAYFSVGDDYNSIVAYWRPKTNTVSTLLSSQNYQNDFVEVKLTYQGSLARVATSLVRDDIGYQGYDNRIWVTSEQPGGGFTVAGLPSDGNHTYDYLSFAVGSAAQGAVVAQIASGNEGNVRCGEPPLIRSSDLQNWTACSPYGSDAAPFSYANVPQLRFAGNDRLYLVATDSGEDSQYRGIFLWRE